MTTGPPPKSDLPDIMGNCLKGLSNGSINTNQSLPDYHNLGLLQIQEPTEAFDYPRVRPSIHMNPSLIEMQELDAQG